MLLSYTTVLSYHIMVNDQTKMISGVLNTMTLTVHKQETGGADLHTECGHTHYVDPDRLRPVAVERVIEELNASKCGECFEDGGGY